VPRLDDTAKSSTLVAWDYLQTGTSTTLDAQPLDRIGTQEERPTTLDRSSPSVLRNLQVEQRAAPSCLESETIQTTASTSSLGYG
jgi:hypothetical protein